MKTQAATPAVALSALSLERWLLSAVAKGGAAVVQKLLADGANPNAILRPGFVRRQLPFLLYSAPVLHLAAYDGAVAILGDLLRSGAEVNAVGPIGFNALQLAAGFGHPAAVAALLEFGAEVAPNSRKPSAVDLAGCLYRSSRSYHGYVLHPVTRALPERHAVLAVFAAHAARRVATQALLDDASAEPACKVVSP